MLVPRPPQHLPPQNLHSFHCDLAAESDAVLYHLQLTSKVPGERWQVQQIKKGKCYAIAQPVH